MWVIISAICDSHTSATATVSDSSYLRFLQPRCEITSICWVEARCKAASLPAGWLVMVDLTSPGCRQNSGAHVVNFLFMYLNSSNENIFHKLNISWKPLPMHLLLLPSLHSFVRGSVKWTNPMRCRLFICRPLLAGDNPRTTADSRQLTLGTELKGQPAKCLERALDTAVCLRTITAPAPPGACSLLRHLQWESWGGRGSGDVGSCSEKDQLMSGRCGVERGL